MVEGPRWNFTDYRFCSINDSLCKTTNQSLIFSISTDNLQGRRPSDRLFFKTLNRMLTECSLDAIVEEAARTSRAVAASNAAKASKKVKGDKGKGRANGNPTNSSHYVAS